MNVELQTNNSFEIKSSIKEKISFKNYNLHNWLSVLGLFVFGIGFIFSMVQIFLYLSGNNEAWKVFFGVIDRFTYQSNWLLLVYVLLYVFKPNHNFFKDNKFLVCTMAYITFTFIGYNVLLVGIFKSASGYNGTELEIAINAWTHAVSPIYFLILGFVTMYYKQNQEPKNILKTVLKGMIYPSIYVSYLASIPFTFVDYRINPSNYTDKVNTGAYSVYGSPTDTYSNPMSWLWIVLMYIFIGLVIVAYCYCWKGINKINKKR